MHRFENISPLDSRYRDERFAEFLSEEARVRYQAMVEAALAKALAKQGICSKKAAREIARAAERVRADEVYAEEKVTRHDVRALANCIRKKVSKEAKPFVHFGATSYDIVDTASVLQYKDATQKLLLPVLLQLEKTLLKLALRYRKTVQIGRTHGQHAEPITFGFALSYYVDRLGNRIKAIEQAKDKLRGKFSGAVGAYNASSLLVKNPLLFEKDVMHQLGLLPSIASTQIVAPEARTDLMHAMVSCFGVLANFSDDMRNLQRSEISEVAEAFGKRQVGSSTMPHKRNPINFENVKSFYKQFLPRMLTVYLDQISEHQRDLTNSASQRFVPELFAALALSAERLQKVCGKLVVDKEAMQRNFSMNKGMVVAEPLYILLAFHGHANAHEAVRQLTMKAEKEGKPLLELAEKSRELQPFLRRFTARQRALLAKPEKYTGIAAEKTAKTCSYWKKELGI